MPGLRGPVRACVDQCPITTFFRLNRRQHATNSLLGTIGRFDGNSLIHDSACRRKAGSRLELALSDVKHAIQWLPGVETLRRYEAAWLSHDIFTGLVLAAMLVPVGVAYAQASGLAGIYSLYATIIPLLAYAVVWPKPHSVLGRTPLSQLSSLALSFRCPAIPFAR